MQPFKMCVKTSLFFKHKTCLQLSLCIGAFRANEGYGEIKSRQLEWPSHINDKYLHFIDWLWNTFPALKGQESHLNVKAKDVD